MLLTTTLKPGRIRQVRDIGIEGWVVLAVREVGGDEPEEGARKHVLPVVTIVHSARDSD